MVSLRSVSICSFLVLGGACAQSRPQLRPASPGREVLLRLLDGRCRVTIGGKLFCEYIWKDGHVPYVFPVVGPGGHGLTRHFPITKAAPGETKDHRHHRSLWFAHGDVRGHDFWTGRQARIVQDRASTTQDGVRGALTTFNRWVVRQQDSTHGGGSREVTLLRDVRTISFWADRTGRYMDWRIELQATDGDVVFGDTKEGTLAIRVAPSLRTEGSPKAAGMIRNSEGVVGKKAWGKRARWVDYSGPIEGSVVGIALFDHPGNHGYPCRWHARAYGLLAANPWGVHQFEGAPPGTGAMKLAKGEVLRLRYRFFFHEGSPGDAGVEAAWRRFAAEQGR